MLIITAGTKTYELKTTLGTAMKLENKFKLPLTELFGKIDKAEINELTDILAIAADKQNEIEFKSQLYDNWDYTDLQMAVQELLARIMFSGTTEQIEHKLEKFPVSANQKNAIRSLLGIPLPAAPSTAVSSSEPVIEQA